MNRISAIALSLLLIILGLTVEAHAVTSGVYKCYVAQGPTSDPSTFLVPDITHYNPNAGIQSITRIRIFNALGALIYDQAFAPGTLNVNGHGSNHAAVAATGLDEGLQVIVNWRQAGDALAPIPRLVLLLFDATSGIFTSVSQSNC